MTVGLLRDLLSKYSDDTEVIVTAKNFHSYVNSIDEGFVITQYGLNDGTQFRIDPKWENNHKEYGSNWNDQYQYYVTIDKSRPVICIGDGIPYPENNNGVLFTKQRTHFDQYKSKRKLKVDRYLIQK